MNTLQFIHTYLLELKIIDIDKHTIQILLKERSPAGIIQVRNQIFVEYITDK
jgi:hypothetical protein